MRFDWFTGFLDFIKSMNECIPINLEHWTQIINTIPEIISAEHGRNQTTDKRILQ
jgi:hypothetical protein